MKDLDLAPLFTLSYGLYTIGAKFEGKLNAQIANSVFQITADPPRVAVSISRSELTNELIKSSGYLSIGVLSQEATLPFIGHFGFNSGRDINKFETIDYFTTKAGAPCPKENVVGCLELKIESAIEVDTHTLFIGKMTDTVMVSQDIPMTYAYYREVLCGKTPPSAPSFVGKKSIIQAMKGNTEMKKYVCDVCGYEYDPAIGDPDSGIAPGTAFKDIPEDWVCPVCGVSKDQFSEV